MQLRQPQTAAPTEIEPPRQRPQAMPTPRTMRTLVCNAYGGPEHLAIENTATPQPRADEVLVRVGAANLSAADAMMRQGTPWLGRLFLGWRKPKVAGTGTGFAGTVVQVGEKVSTLRVGQRVFGETGVQFAAHADYVCVPAAGLIMPTPDDFKDEAACALCDGPLTSSNFLFDLGQLEVGQHVLINGASGSLGTAAVQLAKQQGARVTAVCSATNAALLLSLGADTVIDYHSEDFTQRGESYDLIYDCVGKRSFLACRPALRESGRYISPVLDSSLLLHMVWTRFLGRRRALFSATGLLPMEKQRRLLDQTLALYQAGQLKIVIDHSYPLEDAVAANAYVDSGRKRGNVVFDLHRENDQ